MRRIRPILLFFLTAAAMSDTTHLSPRRSFPLVATVLAVAALMAGCAQQRSAGYYDLPRESSVTDAEAQAQGAGYLPIVQPPAQLQIGLNSPSPVKPRPASAAQASADGQTTAAANTETVAEVTAATTSAAAHSLVPQAQTYSGTLPCVTTSNQCVAQKLILTLAPNGRWRSRSASIDSAGNSGTPSTTQGCWDASSERPTRVWLNDAAGNQIADFIVSANNVLRVKSALGVTPNLNYNLTRQPDLDPINELNQQAVPKCAV